MQVSRRAAAILGALPLGACAVTGPLFDRSMEDAPTFACARPLTFFIRGPDGRSLIPYSAVSIPAGTEVMALPGGAGDFTHVVLTGSTPGAGAMRVMVSDRFARGDRGRTLRWHAPRQRWTVPNIGTAVHNPAGVRIAVLEGEIRIDQLCLKSYIRRPAPPPPEERPEH